MSADRIDAGMSAPRAPVADAAAASSRMWRTLDDYAGTANQASTDAQSGVTAELETPGRRRFLQLMAASLALGGAGGCSRPRETIVPYVHGPAQDPDAGPLFYATALTHRGYGCGVLVECNQGRPTKIEGNPLHPSSLGATSVFGQAAVLDLWDPDRSQAVVHAGEIAAWQSFLAALRDASANTAASGKGLHVLSETVTSPTLHALSNALLEKYPQASWHQYQPLNRDCAYAGATLAFGRPHECVYAIDRASVILALDADFLNDLPGHLRYAREFAGARQASGPQPRMNRLYVVEPTPTLTGAAADHRLALRACEIYGFARKLAAALGVQGMEQAGADDRDAAWIGAIAADLKQHPGAALVIAGDRQPAEVHALAHAMNALLGAGGRTVRYTRPVVAQPSSQLESIRALSAAMAAGEVDALVILGGNPVYNAPADLEFGRHLRRVGFSAHLGLYRDETARQCQWHIPAAHELECWGDARAHDGTASLQQPAIAPLYAGKSALELVSILLDGIGRSGYELVRSYWQRHSDGDFDAFWNASLHAGVVAASAFDAETATVGALALPAPAAGARSGALELVFAADPSVDDGRFANNAWLQELPRPITKLTWDNAALISPAFATRHSIANADLVAIELDGHKLSAAAWITPGHADGSIGLTLGYGRTQAGRVGSGAGHDTYGLRRSSAPWIALGAQVQTTGRRYLLASTQGHQSMLERAPVRHATLAEYQRRPGFAHDDPLAQPSERSLYSDFAYRGYRWAMSIDLNSCIGCNACTIACQAENNIPVVGKDQVRRGREMHWIRVDRYHDGEPAAPRTFFQPVPCMQCEHAPCEVVCPVEASVHDSEGINVQVYNRCVGTRFCSNNCPYKVRRFNFFQYSRNVPSLNAQRNPEVSVRMRGVMEKCNYCLQRVTNARIEADRQDRRLRDGEVVTACQAVCPTRAIVFGDLNDPDSAVSRAKAMPRDYALLAELNTRPRTSYGARLRNPNPKLEPV